MTYKLTSAERTPLLLGNKHIIGIYNYMVHSKLYTFSLYFLFLTFLYYHHCKGKGKGRCLIVQTTMITQCSAEFTIPLARWAPMQSATLDPTLYRCTRYPLLLGEPRQCGI